MLWQNIDIYLLVVQMLIPAFFLALPVPLPSLSLTFNKIELNSIQFNSNSFEIVYGVQTEREADPRIRNRLAFPFRCFHKTNS